MLYANKYNRLKISRNCDNIDIKEGVRFWKNYIKNMVGVRGIEVNNVINKDLTFKFDAHLTSKTMIIPIILIVIAILGGKFFYLWIIGLFIIVIIYNKLLAYSISFDTENIIIKNTFKKHMLCYKYGIRIKITKGRNFHYGMGGEGRLYKQLFKESDAKYYLVIDYYGEQFVLDSYVDDSKVQDIMRFIENFSFEKNLEYEQKGKNYIRFSDY